MKILFSLLFSVIFSTQLFANNLNGFKMCSGTYEVVSAQGMRSGQKYTPDAQKIIIRERSLTIISTGKPLTLLLTEEDWSEEGYFGIAGFKNTSDTCFWYQGANSGGQQISVSLKNNGIVEYQDSCYWTWTCNHINKLVLRKIAN